MTSESNLREELPAQFLRLARRVINERPRSDARWRHAFPNRIAIHTDAQGTLTPEGCIGFQFVTSARCVEPILPQSRFDIKTESLTRLAELWKLTISTVNAPRSGVNVFIPLTDVCSILGYCLPSSEHHLESGEDGSSMSAFSTHTRRWMAGEKELHETHEQVLPTEPNIQDGLGEAERSALCSFASSLADEDNNAIESFATRLVKQFDPDKILRAADDCPLDNIGTDASVHILAGLDVAGELVEFTRGLHAKLSRDPEVRLQPVFQAVAMEAGFSANCLQVVGPQEAVMQTVSSKAFAFDRRSFLYLVIVMDHNQREKETVV
ncbi:unnamed protein product [Echinostoma caproni]|uniref:Uncharacterized protein n=1 Tax=Echinostoma caproni TaxID=27848 RepID=A0A3P8J1P5_9TREM|nr:unnamed protein product [Echinostoma caproni]